MIGRVISHYRVIEQIGAGGMGVVFKAEDITLKRQVALKFLPPELTQDPVARSRLLHEARAASALQHENICALHEIGESDDGRLFLCLDYYEGETLKERLTRGPLSTEEALDLTVQVAHGLEEAHRCGIVHRDIKPANVMVTTRGVAKILDFGLAKASGQSKLTKTGSTVGTIAYMSPEQVRGEEVDGRSDIFSLGVMLYELLTGASPFTAEHEPAIMHKILNVAPPSLRTTGVRLAAQLEPIVGKMLAKEPGERYQSIDEVVQALSQIGSSPSVYKTRFARPVVLGIGALALAVTVAVYLLLPRDRESAIDAAAQNRLAVLRFANLVNAEDPQRYGDIVANLLTTGLSQAQDLTVISNQRMDDLMRETGKSDVGEKIAVMDLGNRVRARWIISGAVVQEAPALVVSYQMVEVRNGDIVVADRVTQFGAEPVFSLVDTIAARITAKLSIPATAEVAIPLADVTTSSLAAYRYYVEGMRELGRARNDKAVDKLRLAVGEDSTFAMANCYLAIAMQTLSGYVADEAEHALSRAVRYAHKATDKEKRLIEIVKDDWDGNNARALANFDALVERYPDEKMFFYVYGWLAAQQSGDEKAIGYASRLLELDPTYGPAYADLAYLYQARGDFERSLRAINSYIDLRPQEPHPYKVRGDILSAMGNLAASIESYRKATELDSEFDPAIVSLGRAYLMAGENKDALACFRRLLDSRDPSSRAMGRLMLANVPIMEGRRKAALETLSQGIAADRLDKGAGNFRFVKNFRKAELYLQMGETDLAIAELDSVRQSPTYAASSEHVIVARLLARAGRMDEARDILEEATRERHPRAPAVDQGEELYWLAYGWLEMEKETCRRPSNTFGTPLRGRRTNSTSGTALGWPACGQIDTGKRWKRSKSPSRSTLGGACSCAPDRRIFSIRLESCTRHQGAPRGPRSFTGRSWTSTEARTPGSKR